MRKSAINCIYHAAQRRNFKHHSSDRNTYKMLLGLKNPIGRTGTAHLLHIAGTNIHITERRALMSVHWLAGKTPSQYFQWIF
jgi:hypothetical protein